jgi:hypothetical protein
MIQLRAKRVPSQGAMKKDGTEAYRAERMKATCITTLQQHKMMGSSRLRLLSL